MRSGASRVALAGLIGRLAGLVRERLFARYLGTSDVADAFNAAVRIPALMESVLGVGVMSSAFIPRYSKLLGIRADRDARHLARTVGAVHLATVAVIVTVGILAAPLLVQLVVPGFGPEKADFTVRLVRILFPAIGLIVWGAWCLGVLNSHRRFFLPYVVPVVSAISVSVALVWSGRTQDHAQIAIAAAWGTLIGAALQLAIQLPVVFSAIGSGDDSAAPDKAHVRVVRANMAPTALRGVIHRLGVWIEIGIAASLSTGAIAGVEYARILYGLPFSLFTVSIAAALLPKMSSASGEQSNVSGVLMPQLNSALRTAAFYLIPCAVAFIALGDVITGAIYLNGIFTADDARYVWAILGAMAVGLVGSSMGGMYATAFYALSDTVMPLKAAALRLVVRAGLGFVLAIPVTRALGLDARWGAVGLGVAIGVSGWIEYVLLRRWMVRRMAVKAQRFTRTLLTLWGVAGLAAGLAWAVKLTMPDVGPVVGAVPILGTFGVVYLGATWVLGVPEARGMRAAVFGGARSR